MELGQPGGAGGVQLGHVGSAEGEQPGGGGSSRTGNQRHLGSGLAGAVGGVHPRCQPVAGPEGRYRGRAATAQGCQDSPFLGDRESRVRVLQGFEGGDQGGITGPALDPERPLPGCGQDGQFLSDPSREPEAAQPRRGQHHRIQVAGGHPGQPGVDVAADVDEDQVGTQGPQLRHPPR